MFFGVLVGGGFLLLRLTELVFEILVVRKIWVEVCKLFWKVGSFMVF